MAQITLTTCSARMYWYGGRQRGKRPPTPSKFVDPALAPVQPKSIHTLSTELAAEDTN